MSLRDYLLENPMLKYQNNIFYEKDLQSNNTFEGIYLKLRARENRIHSDDVVKHLPLVDSHHPNSREWEMRKSSLQKLTEYLRSSGAKTILELGCGNGWLSHNLSNALKAEICAIDVNETELIQGARVFSKQENLCFLYTNIFSRVLKPKKFDAVVLGSSIQYFEDVENLIVTLFDLMNPSGLIYILDSPIYKNEASAVAAKDRSVRYFDSLGFSAMANQYFHHTFAELSKFKYEVRYNPNSFISLMRRKVLGNPLSVFPIIALKKISAG